MSTWTVVYERTAAGWSAYVPALPGAGVAGATREETEQLISEAIVMHLEGMTEDGPPIAKPFGTSASVYLYLHRKEHG